MNFLGNIKTKYYPYLEVIKALVLIVFFYIGLHYVEVHLSTPVYPKCLLEALFLYSFAGFLFLSWLLGERRKNLLVFAYFVTFQIIGLALVLKDPWVIPRVLIPTLLTYLSLFLFKSPEEFEREKQKQLMENLKRKVNLLNEKLTFYKEQLLQLEENYRLLETEKKQIEELYNSTHSEKLKRLLEQKEEELAKSRKQIEELTEKIANLQKNNRELWQLLEESADDNIPQKSREELRRLRKERKKLIKRLARLEEDFKNLEEEKIKLETEKESVEEELNKLKSKFETLKGVAEERMKRIKELETLLDRGIVDYLNLLLERVEFTPRALADFESLSETVKESFLKYLKKLDKMEPSTAKFESLESPNRVVFKDRFSGGRVYFTVRDGKFVIEGVLEGEDEKTKARFIRERFS